MDTVAVLLTQPEQLRLERLTLDLPGADDVVVAVRYSGISAGTERLLWSGRMPPFPGMGYPLVPGYESVGTIVQAGAASGRTVGQSVFVPGAKCFSAADGQRVHGLFGGAAARLVVPGARVAPIPVALGEQGVLLALAATAHHALAGGPAPELIVGHGVFGRLLARLVIARGDAPPTVWERSQGRMAGAEGYTVMAPDSDPRRDYRVVLDAGGDAAILDTLVARLAPQGEIVLAGFYSERLSFAFPPAFMKEARIRVAAEWKPADLRAVNRLIDERRLSLDGLVTHRAPAADAASAYRTAFTDDACLKMVLDWSAAA